MTFQMPDSITPSNIPPNLAAQAVLGYVDGKWPTASELPRMFPGAQVVSLTVLGGSAIATGCDQEIGDLSPSSAATWLHRRIKAGQSLPVLYSSRDSVQSVLNALSPLGVSRSEIRILSAHYGAGKHICAPATCGWSLTADGTQWTDSYAGLHGSKIDMSLLSDTFFANWTFGPVRNLAVASVGPSSVKLTWDSPAVPMPAGIVDYEIAIQHNGVDVASYPRYLAKGSNPETWQGGSLKAGTAYVAMVRAQAAGGAHSGPWAKVSFTTKKS